MPGQCLLVILGGILSLVLSGASAQAQQQQQQGQRQVSSFATGGSTGVGLDGGVFRRRHLRGGSGSGSDSAVDLSEMVATTTTATPRAAAVMTTAAMSELFSRGRSAEAASAPGGKRTLGAGGGFGVVGGEETVADGGGAVGATVAEAAGGADGASREESERKGARAREIKQGSRGSNTRDDGGVEDDAPSQSIAVIALCVGAVTLFLIGWCWLSSVVVCMSCCACKCVKRTSSSSSVSGNPHGKYVDTYANAVQATLCGELANVVCVPDSGVTGTSEDGPSKEPVSTSHSCTPHFNDDGTAFGSSSNDSKRPNRAATRLASAMNNASYGGPDATSATSSSSSSSSSYSAFSAIFRRSLTATAVAPVTPTAEDDSNKSEIHETPFPSVAAEEETLSGGGGGGGEGSLLWQAEEKQSETSGRDSATVARPAARHGIRLFGGADERRSRAGGHNASAGERGRAIPATTARPWTSRFWARIGVTDRGRVGSPNHIEPPGAAAAAAGAAESGGGVGQPCQTNILTSSEGSSACYVEGADGGQGSRAGDHPPVSHRRRGGPRSGSQRRRVGPRASDGGLSGISDGHVRDCATPAISPETSANFSSSSSSSSNSSSGRNSFPAENNDHRHDDDDDGRENDGVAAVSGNGGVADVASPTAAEAVETDGGGAPDNNACPALPLPLGVTPTSADVGSAPNNPGAPFVAGNTTTSIPGCCANGGRGTEGEARSVSKSESSHEATGAMSEGGRNPSATREGGGITAAAAAALARSDHLAKPEAKQAQNQNCSEGPVADDDACKGMRTEETQPQLQAARTEDGRFTCRPGDTQPQTPALPIARVLWRAFSEVDHEKIGETHRLAAQRHQARFGPAPGVQNPSVCRIPIYNPL